MSDIKQLENIPSISFIENMTLEEVREQIISEYKRLYKEKFGRDPELGEADPKYLLMNSFALIVYQTMQYVDIKGKQELLKTATGDSLDNLAALLGITRLPAERAIATEKFSIQEALLTYVPIPAGTRVRSQSGFYFNTLEYAEIPAGDTYVEVTVQAEEPGQAANGLEIGAIDTLVDPIPYVSKVENTTASSGGVDIESDDSLTERIYLAPSQFSSAGPRDAYEYYTKEWRADIADVKVVSPDPCEIQIYAVTDQGALLNSTERAALLAYLSAEDKRPLCDEVSVEEPTEISYNVTLTYYIATSDSQSAATIKSQVETAIADFEKWQRHLGRDINPTELITRIRQAGAKRVTVTYPVHTVIDDTEIPKVGTETITYGGLEDD